MRKNCLIETLLHCFYIENFIRSLLLLLLRHLDTRKRSKTFQFCPILLFFINGNHPCNVRRHR
ncbi:hypothetical protein OpiT1DRAFT_00050 [Opitutaceae bacterium TAV1]|nr:hypothetical protein OpiT1DRAFT_00050 [Opitutaceae bacterium TAV1]